MGNLYRKKKEKLSDKSHIFWRVMTSSKQERNQEEFMNHLLQNTTQLAQAIWAHYLSPQLASGAYAAVDATCGRGNDTVWLTAHCGRVYAFDIQSEAIASTREALQAAGNSDAQSLSQAQASQIAAGVRDVQALSQTQADGRGHKGSDQADAPVALPAVTLIEDSPANLAHYVSEPIGLIVFNLGYLPGGDKQRATQAETTLASLQAALDKLSVGGLLSVTMYWGHETGKAERAAVLRWAAALDRSTYHCVHTDMCNQPNCPPEILFVTRKKSRGSLSAQDSRESDGNGHAR